MIGKEIKQSDLNRFWERVNKSTGENECWEWKGYIKPRTGIWDGAYGEFSFNSKHVRAHRFSYYLHFGEFDPKLLVCHKCDNTKCVNPNHLFLGTYLDNNRDTVNKGRRAKTQNIEKKTHCKYGHELIGDNIKLHKNSSNRNGKVYINCRTCAKKANSNSYYKTISPNDGPGSYRKKKE